MLSRSLANRALSANFVTGGAGLLRRLLLFVAAPARVFWIINRRLWLYPLALWGAETWLRACGAKVKVIGAENLKKGQSYVFVSNHRSYLDTAALFRYAGKRIGLVAKKELKVPVLGQGMSFVNIIAIDRSNPEALCSHPWRRHVRL